MAKKALLIGIDDYHWNINCDKRKDRWNLRDLKACAVDVLNMRQMLQTRFGFKNDEVRVLSNERATKAAIIERLDHWLLKKPGAGDRLLFYFSGHGSMFRERTRGGHSFGPIYEILCPHDMDWDDKVFISDQELLERIEALAKMDVTLEVILDCCFSEGMAKLDPELARKDVPESHTRVKFLSQHIDVRTRIDGDEEAAGVARFRKPDSKALNCVLWSAAKPDQSALTWEFSGLGESAFTHFFCRTLRGAEGRISRGELLRRIRDSMKFNDIPQVPAMHRTDDAALQRRFLSLSGAPPVQAEPELENMAATPAGEE